MATVFLDEGSVTPSETFIAEYIVAGSGIISIAATCFTIALTSSYGNRLARLYVNNVQIAAECDRKEQASGYAVPVGVSVSSNVNVSDGDVIKVALAINYDKNCKVRVSALCYGCNLSKS